MGLSVFPASGGATTPIGATSLLYSGAAPYGGTSLTGLSLAAGTYAVVVNQQNAERGILTTANNGTFNLDGNRPTYVTLTTTETTFNIGGGFSTMYSNISIGRSRIHGITTNTTDSVWISAIDSQANGTYRLRYSTDFVTWLEPTTYPSSFDSNNYIYAQLRRLDGGNFVCLTRNSTGNNFAFTTNGTAWTTATLPGSTFWRGSDNIDYSASLGRWLAFSDPLFNDTPAGGRAAISTNGTTWTEISATTLGFNSSNSYLAGCAIGETATNKYVVTGTVGQTTPRIMSSTDGTTWTSQTVPTIAGNWNIYNVTWSATAQRYVAQTAVNNNIVSSTDGVTWTAQTIDMPGIEFIFEVGGLFWMNSTTSAKIAYSTNGTSWTIVKRAETGNYFPDNGWVRDAASTLYPRRDAKVAYQFMSTAQDNSGQYGTNRHVMISWEPLTYMIYSTNIANV
jgi:hypothetical protein